MRLINLLTTVISTLEQTFNLEMYFLFSLLSHENNYNNVQLANQLCN